MKTVFVFSDYKGILGIYSSMSALLNSFLGEFSKKELNEIFNKISDYPFEEIREFETQTVLQFLTEHISIDDFNYILNPFGDYSIEEWPIQN